MEKSRLREKYLRLRKTLSSETISAESIKIANNSLSLSIWDYQYYHIFLPIENKNEVDTSYILSILQGKDKEIIISKSDFSNHTLKHILLTDGTRLKISEYGIPEPENGVEVDASIIQVIFIPLLAYDRIGNRVGYGKGFYDRFLEKCDSKSIKIGLSFFEPELLIEEATKFDIPLDYCITPNSVYNFTK